MTILEAIEAIESGKAEKEEFIAAFQTLIDNDAVWQLQGFYGRMAAQLINVGLCDPR